MSSRTQNLSVIVVVALTTTLVALKLAGVLTWSWLWIVAPVVVPMTIIASILIAAIPVIRGNARARREAEIEYDLGDWRK